MAEEFGLQKAKDDGLQIGSDPKEAIADLRLLQRAIKRGWKIPEKAMEVLPIEMVRIAINQDNEEKDRIAATKAVIAMHGQNQADDPAEQRVRHEHTHTADVDERRSALVAICRRVADARGVGDGGAIDLGGGPEVLPGLPQETAG